MYKICQHDILPANDKSMSNNAAAILAVAF